jgi:hypothetical protein
VDEREAVSKTEEQVIDKSIRAVAGIRVGDTVQIIGYRHYLSVDTRVVDGFSRWVGESGYCMHLGTPLYNGVTEVDLAWAGNYSRAAMKKFGVEVSS